MIVGLVGRSRAGKDTAARFLQGYTIKRLALPVKQACQAFYGWSEDFVESSKKDEIDPKWNIKPRAAMVHLTNSVREFMGQDFFVRRFFDAWNGSPVVIPDVRYESDIREIHRRGGITIKIIREGSSHHEFENSIDGLETTFTIQNNGTIEDFEKSFIHCMEQVRSYAGRPEV